MLALFPDELLFFLTKHYKQKNIHVSACSYSPLTSPSSVFAKRDNEPASSVSEQLQSRNADEETEMGLKSLYQKEPVFT